MCAVEVEGIVYRSVLYARLGKTFDFPRCWIAQVDLLANLAVDGVTIKKVIDLLAGGGTMSGKVEVDPVDLRMSANQLAMHGEDLRTSHTESDADIEATQTGWAGQSATAMGAKLAEWQQFTARICADLDAHQGSFRAAADAYEVNDADSAGAIASQTID